MKVKKALVGIAAGALLTLGASAPALADGFYVGGGASQWQVIANSVITDHVLSQEQVLIQQTNFMIGDTNILSVNVIEYGYVEQGISEGGAAYTATSNYGAYEVGILEEGVIAASSATAITTGDAYGISQSFSEVELNFPGDG